MNRLEQAVWLVLLCSAAGASAFVVPARHPVHPHSISVRHLPPNERFHIPPTTRCFYRWLSITNSDEPKHEHQPEQEPESKLESNEPQQESNIRKKVKQLANNFVVRPIVSTAPLPRAIASVLRDATVSYCMAWILWKFDYYLTHLLSLSTTTTFR